MRRLSKQTDVLHRARFTKRFASVYEELDLKKGPLIFLQPAFFLVRRVILAVTIVVVPHIIVQIYLIVAQTLVAVIIMQYIKPFSDASKLKIEVFNETILVLVLYTMICFTPWIRDVEAKV